MRISSAPLMVVALVGILTTAGCGAGSGDTGRLTPGELLRSDEHVLNVAPRGAHLARPEHTLLAYDYALEVGADGLELDVQATSDGVLVMMFDDTIDRTTNGTGLLKETTFEELQGYDAGWAFTLDDGQTFPYRAMGATVPTLAEVLARYPDVPMFIEARQGDPPIVDALIAEIRDADATSRVVITSFDAARLAEIRSKAPQIATTMGTSEVVEFLAVSGQAEPEPAYVPPAEFLLVPAGVVNDDFVATARSLDLRTYVFTVNDRVEMASFIELGVDGVLTDDPQLMTEVIQELEGGAP